MLPLYLLAAHLVGDFVLQTRWQAAGKTGWKTAAVALRARHVLAYCVPFIPLAIVYAPDARRALGFMAWLYALHFLTDSRRFYSTLGDVVAWRFSTRRHVTITGGDVFKVGDRIRVGAKPLDPTGRVTGSCGGYTGIDLDLEPNPWTPVPILIDQALHFVQLAVLGGLLLT